MRNTRLLLFLRTNSKRMSIAARKKQHFFDDCPRNCTDLLQPLDLSVNKPFKDHLRHKFQSWYADQVFKELQEGKNPDQGRHQAFYHETIGCEVDNISINFDYIRSQSGIIYDGFAKAGIVEALEVKFTRSI